MCRFNQILVCTKSSQTASVRSSEENEIKVLCALKDGSAQNLTGKMNQRMRGVQYFTRTISSWRYAISIHHLCNISCTQYLHIKLICEMCNIRMHKMYKTSFWLSSAIKSACVVLCNTHSVCVRERVRACVFKAYRSTRLRGKLSLLQSMQRLKICTLR